MKNKNSIIAAIAVFLCLSLISCASQSAGKNMDRWPEFYTENPPASVLVMPPINLTNNVDAKDYFYYTLQTAVANRGYYSFPPLLSYEVLQQESAYDSELFLESDIAAFRRTFGADLLLFTKITNWKKHPVGGKVDVEIEYIIRSTTTGNTVYSRKMNCVCDTSVKSGLSRSGGIFAIVGVLVDAIGTAVKTAATDYTIVARGCNQFGIDVPAGKYSPYFGKDYDTASGANPGNIMIQTQYVTDNAFFTPATLDALSQKQAAPAMAGAVSSKPPATVSSSSSQPSTPAATANDNPVAGNGAANSGVAVVPGAKVTLTVRGVSSVDKILFTGDFVEGDNYKKGVLGKKVDDKTRSVVVTVPPSGHFSWRTVHLLGASSKTGVITFSNRQWSDFGWENVKYHTDQELEISSPKFER